ncbi:Crp/Fnr family transcriptional regulator [Clostridium sp. MB40-C1]|uniref:Crp/Fnr family transcriptional regulator n=1 Tax=Clostridium sp. MB40-C1 TaxID=3070996 RepID=UPI0027DF885E|nr:Crp/Fnr family transcriptional regulator [Clostridium sp. MB40-C1]WMJ80405.1 Crp/Fnr family transcriptional regulator [Clostridium sp. MB40-C1]
MYAPRYYFTDSFRKYETLFHSKEHEIQYYKKGEYLCGINDSMDTIFYIVSGTAKLSILHQSGHEKNFSFHGAGTIQPLYYPVNFSLEHSVLLLAISDMEVLAFKKEDFSKIVKENPEMYETLLEGFVRMVDLLMYDTANLLFNDGLVKTCNFLYSYLVTGGCNDGIIRLSQNDLASMIGMNRTNTAKYLKALREKKIIKTDRNCITIIDKDKLLYQCSSELREI